MTRIALVAGHYPQAPGAQGNGLSEHDVAVSLVESAIRYVVGSASDVEIVRIDTGTIPQKVRQATALHQKAPIKCYISVHMNETPLPHNPNVNGSEVLYWHGARKSKIFAQLMLDALIGDLHLPNRGIKMSPEQTDGRSLGELRTTPMPSIIVEPAFIGSQWTLDAANRDRIAVAIAKGVVAIARKEVA